MRWLGLVSSSDVVVVVVVAVVIVTWAKLTYYLDQEYLQVLQQKLRESKKDYKQLFVVHNYMEARTELQLYELWQVLYCAVFVVCEKPSELLVNQ